MARRKRDAGAVKWMAGCEGELHWEQQLSFTVSIQNTYPNGGLAPKMQDPHSHWQNDKRWYKTIREVMCLFHTEVVLSSPQPVYSSSISRIKHQITRFTVSQQQQQQ